jgi:hypothetical protein
VNTLGATPELDHNIIGLRPIGKFDGPPDRSLNGRRADGRRHHQQRPYGQQEDHVPLFRWLLTRHASQNTGTKRALQPLQAHMLK